MLVNVRNVNHTDRQYVHLANRNSTPHKITAVGTAVLRQLDPDTHNIITATLRDVHLVPSLSESYISVPQLQSHGVSCSFHGSGATMRKGSAPPIQAKLVEGTNFVFIHTDRPIVRALQVDIAEPEDSLTLWHRRLGHIDPSAISKTVASNPVLQTWPSRQVSSTAAFVQRPRTLALTSHL